MTRFTKPRSLAMPTVVRLALAGLTVLVLFGVAACSSGSSEPATEPESPSSTTEAAESNGAGTGADDDTDADNERVGTVPDRPTFLRVKDDVVVVPVFDGPGGVETPVFDRNEIDDIELEYPLLATTEFGNRLVLSVSEFDDSAQWARVRLPVRPNGTTAWVSLDDFERQVGDHRITIDLSDQVLRVFEGDELLRESAIAAGRADRPTPVVETYVDEIIAGATLGPAFGDWVLSLAAYSESVGTFNGGLPKLAIAGTDDPQRIGQNVTSGIVQVPNDMIGFLAETVPPGTPVDIVG